MGKIGILGVGFVGKPLAEAFAAANMDVVGFDINPKRIAFLHKISPAARVTWTDRAHDLSSCRTFIICIPTPLTKRRTPDLTAFRAACQTIALYIRKGNLIVVESTIAPETIGEVLVPMLKKKGFRPENDVYVAHAPERIDPGNKTFTIQNTPRIIGGIGPKSTEKAVLLYRRIVEHVHSVSSLEAAAFTKLFENSFRLVNISFVNEMAHAAERLGLDIWKILDAAETKPFAFLRHNPGPGVGGHCIPIDPLYLQSVLKKKHVHSQFIALADQINQNIPNIIVTRCKKILKSMKRKNILLIGITYKPNVADTRESSAVIIARKLLEKGAHVSYHDPLVPTVTIGRTVLHSIPLTRQSLTKADLTIILTPHDAMNWKRVKKYSHAVLDPRGKLR